MEQQFFTWKNWDQMDTMAFYFYDCQLTTDVGEFKKGTKVDGILVDYGEGEMSFNANGTSDGKGFTPTATIAKFKLTLSAEAVNA